MREERKLRSSLRSATTTLIAELILVLYFMKMMWQMNRLIVNREKAKELIRCLEIRSS